MSCREEVQSHDSPDGGRIDVHWYGSASGATTALVLLPGLGIPARYYRELARVLAGRGHVVAVVSPRAQGASVRELRHRDHGFKDVLDTHLAAAIPAIQTRVGATPLVLVGHSLGGQLALLYASRRPEGIRGVALIAGGSNHYATVSRGRRLQRYLGVRAVRLVNEVLGFFPGDKLGFGGRQPKTLMSEWTHEALHGTYRIVGDERDAEADLAALDKPVLFLSIASDRLVPRRSAEALRRKLKRARTELVELEGRAFSAPVDHFRWAKDPGPVVDALERWVASLR